MKAGLRSFQKYVPADLVRALLASGAEARLGGERKVLTVLFSDIAGFTGLAEKLDPEKLVDILAEYLEVMSQEIAETGGTVDKYIGDAIMAFWGAPRELPDHSVAACVAAMRMQERLLELREHAEQAGAPPLHMRTGIHSGELIVGNIGSESRLSYTAMGDTVNLSSRLEGLNSFYGTAVLISEATFKAAEQEIVARPLERVSVKGRSKGTLVYELLGLRDGLRRRMWNWLIFRLGRWRGSTAVISLGPGSFSSGFCGCGRGIGRPRCWWKIAGRLQRMGCPRTGMGLGG